MQESVVIARVRAAICAEIDRQMEGPWSVPFSLDAVAKAAAREAVAALSAQTERAA